MILERAGCVEDAVAQQPAVRVEAHQVPEAGAGRAVGAVDDLAVRVLDRRLGHLDARDDPPVSEPDDALGVPGLRLQADGIDEFPGRVTRDLLEQLRNLHALGGGRLG